MDEPTAAVPNTLIGGINNLNVNVPTAVTGSNLTTGWTLDFQLTIDTTTSTIANFMNTWGQAFSASTSTWSWYPTYGQSPVQPQLEDPPPPPTSEPEHGHVVNSVLTPEEVTRLLCRSGITVPSAVPGRTYHIPWRSGGMVEVTNAGTPNCPRQFRLCLQPEYTVLSDMEWVALQKALLESDEVHYLRQAIYWEWNSGHLPEGKKARDILAVTAAVEGRPRTVDTNVSSRPPSGARTLVRDRRGRFVSPDEAQGWDPGDGDIVRRWP